MKLTNREALWLWRRRMGLTRPQAAKWHRLTLEQWRACERGWRKTMPPGMPRVISGEAEICTVKRKRAGLSVEALAAIMNHNPRYINAMERGRRNIAPLVRFWRDYGE